MMLPRLWFNHYLALVVLAVLAGGCASTAERSQRKEASTLRLFLEGTADGSDRFATVPIMRDSPQLITIDKTPFLDEGSLIDAAVVDTVGGFAVQLKFDFHGTLALANVSTSGRGSRIAVYSQWTEKRWLAAPVISSRIIDGVFTFTPDATHLEAERIVRGLNNVAVALKNKPKS